MERGRPRRKGHRLGIPAEIAATAAWRTVTVSRYGRRETVKIAEHPESGTARSATPPAAQCW
jgi:hypothetical protein